MEKIKTDKFGLNNKNFLRSFDLLLMGDSFAEGSCVNQEYEPANLLKKIQFKNLQYRYLRKWSFT